MKQGWEIKKLGEVATYVNGYAFKPEHWGESGVPIIRIQNLNNPNAEYNYCDADIPEKFVVKDGDILISWSASLGVYEWNRGKAYLNQHIFKVIFNKVDIHKYFLKYAVNAKLNDMLKDAHGATMKHIVKGDFDNTIIPYPPREEQERIVAELDCLSGVIEKKREQLKQLDALAQSIFYQMFGDPITNEKGWNVKKLGEIATSQIGITYKPENVSDNDEGTIVLRSSNIQNSTLCFEDIVRVKCEIKENKYVKDGDILMCSRNGSFRLVGKVAMIANLPEPMTYGAFMTIIRSPYQAYLFAFFKSPAFRTQLTTSKTATINQITVKMLDEIKVALPPLTLQQQFADRIEAIEKQKELIKQSITQTEELFNSRMDYYFK